MTYRALAAWAAIPLLLSIGGCLLATDHEGNWPCSSEDDCGDGKWCIPDESNSRKVCVTRWTCWRNSDCESGQVCRDAHCEWAECTQEDESACGGYACVTSLGYCRTDCSYASHCQQGNTCHDGACVPMECSGSGQCGGFLCSDRLCLTSCGSSKDCEYGFGCVRSKCEAIQGIGDGCSNSKPCKAGECINGVCGNSQPACVGKACGTDHGIPCGSCSGKDRCDSSGQCVDACGSAVCGIRDGVTCGTCPGGESCDNGTCVAQICSPNKASCVGHQRHKCSADGLVDQVVQTCTTGTATCCTPSACVAPICDPGKPFCTSSKILGTCASDGCDIELGGTNCASSGLDCSLEWGCAKKDTLATDGNTSPNPCPTTGYDYKWLSTGVILQASKTVRLLEFSQSFYVQYVSADLRWFVYEADAVDGPFNRLFYQAVYPSPTQPLTPIESGEVDVVLKAGKFYLIGSWCGAYTPGSCWTFGDSNETLTKPSFGTVKKTVEFCQNPDTTITLQPGATYEKLGYDFVLWTKPEP